MGDIGHQFGFKKEVTWATAVTPDRFVEFVSESLERTNVIANSQGIRSGRRFSPGARRIARQTAAGTVTFEVATKGFGLFFEQLLGSTNSVNTVGTVWTHTFTPGTIFDKSMTIQKGVDIVGTTAQAFTYPGAKVQAAEFSIDTDGLLMMAVDFVAERELDSTALAAASYTTPTVFTYSEGVVKKDNVTVASVRSVPSVRIANNLDVDRVKMGNTGFISQPINQPFDEISGTLDVEFQNLTDFYDLFQADTAFELELLFEGAVIEGGHKYTFQLTIADCRVEGETPKVGGPEYVYQTIPFVGVDHATLPAVEIVYKTTDTAP
jgi:hypothetical protein